jgi:anti-anti-sigma regulatory factor
MSMNAPSSTFTNEALTILVTRTASESTMTWIGESDSRNPGQFLSPIVKQLGTELAGLAITIDLTGLTYMNSATVAPLIACIKAFDASASSVQVLFSDIDWQRTHVQCLRTISRTVKRVRIEVRPAGSSG